MDIRKFIFLIIILYLFPVIYFIFLLQSHSPLLSNTPLNYALFLISGVLSSLLMTHYMKKNRSPELNRDLVIFISILVILYAFFLLLMTYSRYINFISEAIDVAYYHYTIWQLSEFKAPYIWEGATIPVWSQHFEPILFALVPLYWFIKSTAVLMLVQALAVISGAIPIYLTAREYLRSRLLGLGLAFAFLSFGGLQFGIAYGFHPIMFFPTLFLWAYYFYQRKNIKLYFLFILLSLFVKEEVSFILFFWSIYLFFIKKDKRIGSISAVFALAWYFLCFNIIFPFYNKGSGFGYWEQYSQAEGSGLLGIAKLAVLKPFDFLFSLVNPSYKIDTIFQTFGSFSFLLFLFPPSLIIIFPSMMEKLLSSGIAGANGAHYSAAITGVTVVATIESLHYLLTRKPMHKIITDWKLFTGALIFFLAFSSNIFYGYRGYSLIPSVHNTIQEAGLTDENSTLLNQIITAIPERASVSAQYQLAPHIQKPMDKIRTGPRYNEDADFVIVDTQLLPVLASAQELNKNLSTLDNNKNYKVAINSFGVVVYRKVSFR